MRDPGGQCPYKVCALDLRRVFTTVCLKKRVFLPSVYSPLSWLRASGPRRSAPGAGICPHRPRPALQASPRDLTPTCPRGQHGLRGWECDQRPLGPPQYVVRRGRWGRQRAPWRAECSRRDATSLLLCNEKQASAHIGLGLLTPPARGPGALHRGPCSPTALGPHLSPLLALCPLCQGLGWAVPAATGSRHGPARGDPPVPGGPGRAPGQS